MSTQKVGIGFLGGDLADENTLISNKWLELMVVRGNGPEPSPQWGALPAKALDLSHKVDALRSRQEKLRQDLDQAIDVLTRDILCPSEGESAGCTIPSLPSTAQACSGTDSFFKGLARKLFSSKAIR